MTDGPPSPKRVKIDADELGNMTKEDLIAKLQQQNDYIKLLEGKNKKLSDGGSEDESKDTDEKLKQQSLEAARRENTLVMRLTNKEQELQDTLNQIQELKAGQTTSMAQLRRMLLDPAVNLVFQRITKEMEENKEKLKQTQNELSAWKFTPDSQTGKRLMVKCRMLLQENEELGKMIASGRTAKLEGEIALQKTLVTEMKKGQEEMDEFVADLEEDVEGMQSMIYVLQQQLKDTKEQLQQLQAENQQLRKNTPATPVPNGVPMETNSTAVTMETNICTEQNVVNSNNSSPESHQPPAVVNTSSTDTVQLNNSSTRSPVDLDTKTKDKESVEHSGNGDCTDHDNITRDKSEQEEEMETDNMADTTSECKQLESDSRTSNKNHTETNLGTIESTCGYDSSDTWSPQPDLTTKILRNAQDNMTTNGIDTINQSESSTDI